MYQEMSCQSVVEWCRERNESLWTTSNLCMGVMKKAVMTEFFPSSYGQDFLACIQTLRQSYFSMSNYMDKFCFVNPGSFGGSEDQKIGRYIQCLQTPKKHESTLKDIQTFQKAAKGWISPSGGQVHYQHNCPSPKQQEFDRSSHS